MTYQICPRCSALLQTRLGGGVFSCSCGARLMHPPLPSSPQSPSSASTMTAPVIPPRPGRLNMTTSPESPNSLQTVEEMVSSSDSESSMETEGMSLSPNRDASQESDSGNVGASVGSEHISGTISRHRNNHEFGSPARKKSNTGNTSLDDPKKSCSNCGKGFRLLKRWKHSCRSCKQTVCSNCSRGKWPSQMLPRDRNPKNEKTLRVCTNCQNRTEQFRLALLQGLLERAIDIYASGVVQLNCPYQIYPEKMFPLHCAAFSGSIDTVKWLVSQGCRADVVDSKGYTPLAVAAIKGHHLLFKYLVFEKVSTVQEIIDYKLLQRCLGRTLLDLRDTETNMSRLNVGAPSTKEEEEAQLNLALRQSASDSAVNDHLLESSGAAVYDSCPEPTAPNLEVENDDDCVVCFERSIDCVFYPCGHISCCSECATQFKECPVCRAEVKEVVKTYRS